MLDGRRKAALVRAAVLGSSILLMLPGAWGHSATVVEFAQLPAGLAAWQRHSLGIYRVCGPLSKLLYALPAHLAGVRVDYPASDDADVTSRREWELGRVFQAQSGGRYHAIYRGSRLLPILLTVLAGGLICEWSTRLFGTWPGVVSLCAWCWLAPALAHGSLVTSDMPSAVVLLLAARGFWAFLRKPGPATALLAGLALGLAEATKFTLLILYPCWALLLLGRAIQLRAPGRRGPFVRLAALGALVLVVSVVVVDSLYLFQGVGFRLSGWESGRSLLARDLRRLGDRPATAWLLQVPLPIPLEFLRGLDFQLADTERIQPAYLFGQTRLGGWWYWYAVASLVKLPLPALALFAAVPLSLRGVAGDRGSVVWAALCSLVPAAELALAVSATTGTGTNAAFRYLIPSLALLCVWVGRVWDARPRAARPVTAGLLAWLAIGAVLGLPDHLGWQNELGRLGSRDRPALLGDSLDWGQDVARLGAWVSRHSGEGPTLVAVYGLGKAEPYGLGPPTALPTSTPWGQATYLAVSDDILFGYEVDTCVEVAGSRSSINSTQRAALLRHRPFDRVGRTIRVYRLRDVLPDLPPPRIEPAPGPEDPAEADSDQVEGRSAPRPSSGSR